MVNKTDMKVTKSKIRYLQVFEKKAGNVTQTCKAVNISRQTFYRWCDTDDIFNTSVLEIKDSLVDFAESSLLSLIRDKHPAATIFFLKTQGKHRGYSE